MVLAERWNGHGWTVDRIPSPSHVSELDGVSCPSQRTCIAVGQYFRSSHNELHGGYFGWGSGLTVAERWNGRSWSIQHPVNPGGNSVNGSGVSMLNAVSCATTTSCTAVGSYFGPTRAGGGTIAEHWNGKRWSVQKTPASTGLNGTLDAVSCASSVSCMAVGAIANDPRTRDRALAERWNGTKWSVVHLPEPAHTTVAALSGVDCLSTAVCIAVGNFTTQRVVPGTERFPGAGMAERWNGSKWTVRRIRPGIDLASLSCASTHICMAVGPSTEVRLSRTGWSTAKTPSQHDFSAVSCPAKRTCIAVGGGTLAERWNGHRWSRQQTPNPSL